MTYTKEFLISELQRFVKESESNPKSTDMQIKYGYPSAGSYAGQFGTWNNALITAGLDVNKGNLDGTETCDNCGQLRKENRGWYYKNEQRLCIKCYNSDYMSGNLDCKSYTGFAFISQRVSAKTLGLDLKYDCNCSQGFGSKYDLYDENGYGSINVKAGILNKDNAWSFAFKNKYIPDTYIMLGFSSDKSNISHVWITEPEDDLTFDEKKFQFKQKISITNSERGLRRAKSWEVDVEPYTDAYHNMSLENCSILKND